MSTQSCVARGLRWAAAAAVLAGIFVPSQANAARQYVCESLTDGRCVATKDTQFVECACADGSVHEFDAPELQGVDDQQLADACWNYFRETCLPTSETVTCEDPTRGSCEAGNGKEAYIDCMCNDGRRDAQLDAPALADLEGEALEGACYEHLDTACEPLAPQSAPPPAPLTTEDRAATGCSIGGGGAASVLPLLVVVGAWRRRRRR